MHSIIIGTAGHIDHGKTALVRALTGVDADRLPEEKRRGITIDLGFSDLDFGDVRIGFVDVPGHERFVKNMLAGAHGIDVVALIIAADEGVMPQTREHFDICRLLGVGKGLVIITKKDLVDDDLLALVRTEAEELVAESFLADAPIVFVSARTGEGIAELTRTLHDVGLTVPPHSADFIARLPIDRAFIMKGFGRVVTGTLVAGEILEGSELELLPGGTRLRVRGVQVHGNAVGRATAGQRTAVNLGGVDNSAIERGMVLAPVARMQPTQIVDAQIEVLQNAPRPLRSRARVRVHAGAAEVLARVRVLEPGGEIAPGQSGFAQLRFESPMISVLGDRFVIRSYSPSRTIAGGIVLNPSAAKHRGRDAADSRARLEALMKAVRAAQVDIFAELAGLNGLRIAYLEKEGALISERDTIRARTHSRELSAADAQLRGELDQLYEKAGLEAPSLDEAMAAVGKNVAERTHARKILQLLIDAGVLVQVQPQLFFHRKALDELTAKVHAYAARHEPERSIDVASFKELAGVSRKYAIPLLEFLDRQRLTRRAGDRRLIL